MFERERGAVRFRRKDLDGTVPFVQPVEGATLAAVILIGREKEFDQWGAFRADFTDIVPLLVKPPIMARVRLARTG